MLANDAKAILDLDDLLIADVEGIVGGHFALLRKRSELCCGNEL